MLLLNKTREEKNFTALYAIFGLDVNDVTNMFLKDFNSVSNHNARLQDDHFLNYQIYSKGFDSKKHSM